MPWTDMTDLDTDDLATAVDMDAIRGNLEYLLDPNSDAIKYTGGNKTLAVTGTWYDMDATNLKIDITSYGGPIYIFAEFHWAHGNVGGKGQFDFEIDGANVGGSDGLYNQESRVAGNVNTCAMPYIAIGLAAGSHTIKLRFKTNAATLTVYGSANDAIIFSAIAY